MTRPHSTNSTGWCRWHSSHCGTKLKQCI